MTTTDGDATLPAPPAGPQPRTPLGPLRLLEMALFAGVFIAGGVTAFMAGFADEESAAAVTSPPPVPGPAPEATLPELDSPSFAPPDPALGQVLFSNARTEVGPSNGCDLQIDYIWEIDRSLSPDVSGQALIEVSGPGVDGDHEAPVRGNEIRLSLDVTVPGNSAFEADVVSVGGVPAFPTPLEATFTDAFC